MGEQSELLDTLIQDLSDYSNIHLYELVLKFEEAIIQSIFLARNEDAARLLAEYLCFFQDPVPVEIEFFCFYNKAAFHWCTGELDTAFAHAKKALKTVESYGNSLGVARSLMMLGILRTEMGDYSEALAVMEKAEIVLRRNGGIRFTRCLNWLGVVSHGLKLYQKSWSYYSEALEINEKFNFERDQAYVLSNMGLLCNAIGLTAQAEQSFLKSIKIHKKVGNKYGIADSTANLGFLLLDKKKLYEEAESILAKAAEMHIGNNSFSKAGLTLTSQAVCRFFMDDRTESKQLFHKAQELVFAHESWEEQVAYCTSRAQVYMEYGEINKAEKLTLEGLKISKDNLPDFDNHELNNIYSKILFESGDFKQAFLRAQLVLQADLRLDALKSSAMESVIYALTETARGKKKLLQAKEEAIVLEQENAALLLSEQRFKKLINNMSNIGVLALDPDGIVTFWNDTCSELYGYESAEAIGKDLLELIVPKHIDQWFSNFLKEKVKSREFEVNLRAKDGSLKNILVSLVPLKDDEIFVIQVDLTKQRIAENQRSLIEAQMRRTQKLEALGTLAGGIAHDFNNLLQGILGNGAMLRASLDAGSPAQLKAELICDAAESSAELCAQMLDYAGGKPVNHKPFNMNRVLREISVLIETSIPKNISLVMDLPDYCATVSGDVPQIHQVIMNLVINGAEAVETSGEVIISTKTVFMKKSDFVDNLLEQSPGDGEYLQLKVQDTGCGVDPITLTKIFDPFFSTKKTGRGLGLAAVLGIVRGHSGAIMVNSEQGKGTEFSIYLQTTDEVVLAETLDFDPIGEKYLGKSILVVDDEEIVRETIVEILVSLGFEAVSAPGGAEALELLDAGEIPDLMMLDLTMPGLNGAEVFNRLRDRNMSFPVLVVSGYSEEKLSSLFPNELPNGFLQKPFSPDSLSNKIGTIFRDI